MCVGTEVMELLENLIFLGSSCEKALLGLGNGR